MTTLSCLYCESTKIQQNNILCLCLDCKTIGTYEQFKVSYFDDAEQSTLRVLINQVKSRELGFQNKLGGQ